jgi:hypothetical protein
MPNISARPTTSSCRKPPHRPTMANSSRSSGRFASSSWMRGTSSTSGLHSSCGDRTDDGERVRGHELRDRAGAHQRKEGHARLAAIDDVDSEDRGRELDQQREEHRAQPHARAVHLQPIARHTPWRRRHESQRARTTRCVRKVRGPHRQVPCDKVRGELVRLLRAASPHVTSSLPRSPRRHTLAPGA